MSPTAVQKALMVEKVGQPAVIRERPIPTPGQGQIRVRVTVVGLNAYDHRMRDWGLFVGDVIPVVLGNDIAGVVDTIGPDTDTDLQVGDHVFGQTNYLKRDTLSDQSGLQEFCILDTYATTKLPPGFTDDHGANLVCNAIAPFWALFSFQGFGFSFQWPGSEIKMDYSKESIAIVGAGGNCGKYAVQFAALAGFGRIIAVASKEKNNAELLRYGATHVVDRHGTVKEVEAEVRKIVGDDLLYSLDCFALDQTLALSILSSHRLGQMVSMAPVKVSDDALSSKKGGVQARFIQGQSHNNLELAKKYWAQVPHWMTSGKLVATDYDVLEGLDADKINAALDKYRDGNLPPKKIHVHVSSL